MNTRKNLPYILAIIIVVVAAYLILTPAGLNHKSSSPAPSPTPNVEQASVQQQINFSGIKTEQSDIIQIKAGQSVLEVLSTSKQIETKQYSFGKSVESIEGVKSGTDGKYWMYYVNGQLAQVGADQYQLKPGDKVEWKLEKGQ